MNFILAQLPCFELNSNLRLIPNVWYQLKGNETRGVFLFENHMPTVIDINDKSLSNVITFSFKGNNYYILCPKALSSSSFATINYQNKNVQLSISSNLQINIEGQNVLTCKAEGIEYSQYQIVKNHLVIYFKGKRNYFVIIKDNKVLANDFYNEINIEKEEIYFLKRLNDSLNQGKVYCINNEFDNYLVYLDDYDLNLKDEFLPMIMLDLVKAQNYNYANSLLSEELKPKTPKDIGNFFEEFDYFVPISKKDICLLKNDTFKGIVSFEVINGKINNIIID